jgi:hypothetical protein
MTRWIVRNGMMTVAILFWMVFGLGCQKKEPQQKGAPPATRATRAPATSTSASTPPAAAPAPVASAPAYKPRYAQRMFEVALRFHLLGKSVAKDNWGYANQQAVELYETFKSDLPNVQPAFRIAAGVDLKALRAAFTEQSLRALMDVTAKKDKPSFARAYRDAATACNGCHDAVGKGFVKVKLAPGGTFEDTLDLAAGAGK